MDAAFDYLFLVDICIQLRTGYYDRSQKLIYDQRKIAYNYLWNRYGYIDVISSINLEEIAATFDPTARQAGQLAE